MIRLTLLMPLVLGACLSKSTGDEVGSETHFLSVCADNDQCDAERACVCGICTARCTGTCADGSCAAGANNAVVAWCGVALDRGICLAACADDEACGPAERCREGFCGPRLLEDGTPCEADAECEGAQCVLGRCGGPCYLPDDLCAAGYDCSVPGAASGVCVPYAIAATPMTIDGGTIALGTTRDLEVTVTSLVEIDLTLMRAIVVTSTYGAQAETSVLDPIDDAIPAHGRVTLRLRIAPADLGTRNYLLLVSVSPDGSTLPVPITYDVTE